MDKVCLQGGVSLNGTVEISGAKNACMAMMAAALLTDEVCTLRNVPQLRDVAFFIQLLQSLGVSVQNPEPHTWQLQAKNITHEAAYDLVRQMRASVCIMGPLIGRLHQVIMPLPGGCVIGNRPIDLHLNGFKALGCSIDNQSGNLHVKAKHLKGNSIYLGGRFGSTVTGTANVLMAAVLTPGVTVIDCAACEPEIVDLCTLLQQMGASIEGVGSPTLTIRGTDHLKGFDYTVIGDRIEAGTFVLAGLITQGTLHIQGFQTQHLNALWHLLDNIHADISIHEAEGSVDVKPCLDRLTPFETTTLPYPGYPTDMQPQIGVALSLASGISIITESIFENRFKYIDELARMGAVAKVEGNTAIITGVERLTGARVNALDLRAGAALVIAGLAAEGITTIDDIKYIQRGYEKFDEKLRSLGGEIEQISSQREAQRFRLRVV